MKDTFGAAVLGFVQGITEFLPVSSSGHLVLFQSLLPPAGDHVAFDLALHMGTLLPVLVVYRAALLDMVVSPFRGDGPWHQRAGVKRLLWVLVGSVPTAMIGLLFEDTFEALFTNRLAVGVAFLVTGTFLYATRGHTSGDINETTLQWWQAVLIGVAQGLAITPGISRSGATIAAALFLGGDREFAARFSFLLSIPAISGAFLLKAGDLGSSTTELTPLLVGFVVAAGSGYLALRLLLRLVRSGDFDRFAYYLWPLGVASIAWSLMQG